MADEKEFVLTREGKLELENELDTLKNVTRKEVSEKIKEARSFGDLSENAEYDEAKNEQAIIEARIAQLDAMLKNAKVLDDDEVTTDKVSVGSKIRLKDIEFDEEVEYSIVGSTEANPDEGKISDESPIGKGLMGRSVGDVVEIEVPSGMIEFEILEISK